MTNGLSRKEMELVFGAALGGSFQLQLYLQLSHPKLPLV